MRGACRHAAHPSRCRLLPDRRSRRRGGEAPLLGPGARGPVRLETGRSVPKMDVKLRGILLTLDNLSYVEHRRRCRGGALGEQSRRRPPERCRGGAPTTRESSPVKDREGAQGRHRPPAFIDRPMLARIEMSGAAAEALRIDSRRLLDEDACHSRRRPSSRLSLAHTAGEETASPGPFKARLGLIMVGSPFRSVDA